MEFAFEKWRASAPRDEELGTRRSSVPSAAALFANERTQAAMHARLRSPKPEDDQTSGLLMKARRCASNGLA